MPRVTELMLFYESYGTVSMYNKVDVVE